MQTLIVGNWKLNKTPLETIELIGNIAPLIKLSGKEVVVCPSAVCLFAAAKAIKGTRIKLGAQDICYERSGAYTGETSIDALLELGIEYVIIGHSERRQYFGETDESVNKKVLRSIEQRICPIICVGESLIQKEDGITAEVVRMQTKRALKGVNTGYISQIVIAYEPIWAIGSGRTATAEDANRTIREIRSVCTELYGYESSSIIRILYGGSMNPSNASTLLSRSDIDGGLIGGASLDAKDFASIVN
jgi:triosephosphate isomerase